MSIVPEPEPQDHVEFFTADLSAGRITRTGIVQRVWGTRTWNVTITTDDGQPGQTFVRLAQDVTVTRKAGQGADGTQ
jgi:hypothetical protein